MKYKILIVTGLSGAGRSTALKILEDIGFEAIDNLPTHLLKKGYKFQIKKNLAVGIDVRTRDFDPTKLLMRLPIIKKNLTCQFYS